METTVGLPSTSGFDRLRELLPGSMADLDRVVEVAPTITDSRLLALAAERAEAMLRGEYLAIDDSWSDADRAVVDLTEQFVFSVSDVTDQQVDAVLAYMTADELHQLISALFVHEMTYRIEMVAGKVLR